MSGNCTVESVVCILNTCVRVFRTMRERHVSNESCKPLMRTFHEVAIVSVLLYFDVIPIIIIIIVAVVIIINIIFRYFLFCPDIQIFDSFENFYRVCETHTGNIYLEFIPFFVPVGCHTHMAYQWKWWLCCNLCRTSYVCVEFKAKIHLYHSSFYCLIYFS